MPKYQIFDRPSGNLLADGVLEKKNGQYVIERLLPDSTDIVVFVDGKQMQLRSATCATKPKPKVVEAEQIKEMYWSYGGERKRLKGQEKDDVMKSKRYADLNLHVETKDGNDGKVVEVTVDKTDGQQISLRGVISENNVVFEKVFG